MSVSGYYTLTLLCDGRHPGEPESSLDVYQAPTRMEAKAEAREKGWLFTPKNRKAFCSECALERRKTRYKG